MQDPARASLWTTASLLLLTVIACRAPHRDYSLAQIQQVDNLVELMDVQATVADPCFALVDELQDQEVSDAQWARFQDMGTRLAATAARVAEFSKGEDFARWNSAVGQGAAELVDHVANRDKAGALASIRTIQRSCRACHAKYK